MCGRYASARKRIELLEEFRVERDRVTEPLDPDYNVAPTQGAQPRGEALNSEAGSRPRSGARLQTDRPCARGHRELDTDRDQAADSQRAPHRGRDAFGRDCAALRFGGPRRRYHPVPLYGFGGPEFRRVSGEGRDRSEEHTSELQ